MTVLWKFLDNQSSLGDTGLMYVTDQRTRGNKPKARGQVYIDNTVPALIID